MFGKGEDPFGNQSARLRDRMALKFACLSGTCPEALRHGRTKGTGGLCCGLSRAPPLNSNARS